MLKVALISHTPMPEKAVAAAARLCYSPSGADQIMEGLTDQKTQDFVGLLSDMGHLSPFEHAYFTFAIEGVSRSLLAQITRHRIATFSVQSQRYVKKDGFSFIVPPEIAQDEQTLAIFEFSMRQSAENYNRLADMLKTRHKEALIKGGESPKKADGMAEKMAIEDARYVLPNACDTKMMVSMNARALRNFFELRCCFRAQWEIRELAWQMLKLCRAAAPSLFLGAGPSCLSGVCKEGKMSCKRTQEVRKRGETL